MQQSKERRRFITAAAIGTGFALTGLGNARADGKKTKPADVNATEDLMREHGVLRRVLLVYSEATRRLAAGTALPAEAIATSANIIRTFIEGYHEKLEEEQVFPRLEKIGKLVDLTRTLREQHAAGRKLTATILQNATPTGLGNAAQRKALVAAIEAFQRMYEPHAAREDTVLFPAFHGLFTEAEFDQLGDQFEDEEHKQLGEGGFEGVVKQVTQVEQTLGIYDLAQFTPK